MEKDILTSKKPAPDFILDRPWMVKIAVMMLVGSSLSAFLRACSDMTNTQDQNNPLVALVIALPLLLLGGFEGFVAWGMWDLKEWAQKGFIAVVAINTIGFLCGLSPMFTENPATAGTAAIFGLIIRGGFIYWFLDNEQYFKY
jgi:uncharacterized protein YacL